MKNILFSTLAVLALIFVSCDPLEEEKPDIGSAPMVEDLDFTIVQGEDDFTFIFSNTSSVSGMAKWNFGNGQSASGDVVETTFNTPGDYTVELTLYTKGGNASTSKVHATTKTNYAIFTDEKYMNISGGIEQTEGKTWVVDSLTAGHFGIGPAGGTWPEWWSANALAKPGSGAYDDEFVFKIEGFSFGFMNNGDSYVKDYAAGNAAYTDPVALYGEPDVKVKYTPSPATWTITSKADGDYLILSSATPAFFGFDYGGNYEYRIEELTENKLYVSTIGGDGNRWYNLLIPKGYEKPTVTFDASVTPAAGDNTFEIGIENVTIPTGLAVNGYTVTFGDGTAGVNVKDYSEKVSHTFMRKGTYPVIITLHASNEDIVVNQSATVENHHPDYEPFLLDMMVTYVDNSEVEMAPIFGQDCGVELVDNPERVYPNRGVKVLKYTKENQQWANANMTLPQGYRFDISSIPTFKVMVRGKAGQQILLKLENTDRGGNAWQTGTADLIYTIQEDDTWELAEYNFSGVSAGWDWTGDIFTDDVTSDERFSKNFYNVIRIMCNPGVGEGVHEFYLDDLMGPHVEGIKATKAL